jgi:integrase/recombinase XerD
VGKVEIPPLLRDFQAEWESPAFGLFPGAAFSIALLPTNSAIEPEKDEIDELLRAPDRTTEHGQRDYAVLLFLYNSGARAGDVKLLV